MKKKFPETPKLEPEVTNIRQLNEDIKNFFTEKGISKKQLECIINGLII